MLSQKRTWIKSRAIVTLAALALAGLCAAQSRHHLDVDTETEEGKALQAIGTEQDAAKKVTMMEEFAGKYSQHAGYAWVLGQLEAAYVKAQQWDKIFPVVEKLMGFDASDAEMAYGGLQAAVGKNDPDLIVKWATITRDAAQKAEKTPKPEDEDELPAWEYKVKFAKQVQERCEYEIYTAVLRSTDPAQKIKLMDGLLAFDPNTQYATQLDEAYFLCHRQLGNNDKAIEIAKAMAEKGTANEDMLLLLANKAYEEKQADAAIGYSDKLIELMKTKAAPEGVSAEDWTKKKNTSLGAGLFLKGTVLAQQNKLSDADTVFRESMPYLEGNDALLGPALFQLGLANYNLGSGRKPNRARLQDALKYNLMAAKIKGQHQAQANKNATVIRQRYGLK
ncbi:MAG: hypothetical protein R2762_13685 [Bryobacteraceae bacterium]